MEDQRQQTAIAALEVVLRGLLKCGPYDTLNIQTEIADGLPTVLGLSVTRRLVPTDGEVTARFLDGRLQDFQGKMFLFGESLFTSANRFMEEILEPGLYGRGSGIGKLLAGSQAIDLESALFDAASHDEAERRLFPPRES